MIDTIDQKSPVTLQSEKIIDIRYVHGAVFKNIKLMYDSFRLHILCQRQR